MALEVVPEFSLVPFNVYFELVRPSLKIGQCSTYA